MAAQPAAPIAPPWIRASLAKATAGMPPIRPAPASTAPPSSAVSRCSEPSSKNASRRVRGARGSCRAPGDGARCAARLSVTVMRPAPRARDDGGSGAGPAGSGPAEGDGDVVPAEAEPLVDRGHRVGRQVARLVPDDVHHDLGVELVDVD